MKKLSRIVIVFFISCSMISCSQSSQSIFQENTTSAPFNIFHLFDDYPALKAAWDSVPGTIGNHKMAQMMKDDIPGTAEFLGILSYLLDRADSPGLGLLDDIKSATNLVIDDTQRFYTNTGIGSYYAEDAPATHLLNFYGFLDELTRDVGGTTPKVGRSAVSMTEKILLYLLTKSDDDLARYLEELYMPTFYSAIDYEGTAVRLSEGGYTDTQLSAAGIAGIRSIKVPLFYKVTLYASTDLSGPGVEYDSSRLDIPAGTGSLKIEKNPKDMTDLGELAAQPLAMADFPLWIDNNGTPDNAGDDTLITDYAEMYAHGNIVNSDIGNMSKGVQYLMSGMINLMQGEKTDRDFMYDLFGNLQHIVDNPEIIERLLWNMSNYFTPSVPSSPSSVYGTLNTTTLDPDFNANNAYSTDIDGVLYSNAELKESVMELLALSAGLFQRDDRYSSMVYTSMGTTSQEYPLTNVVKHIHDLYINWDQAQLKESIYDMIRYDAHGRDRRTNTEAYAASLLEHLLFLGAITGNFGFKHLPNAMELGDGSTIANTPDGWANKHGHGELCGYLTLNDSLFSAQSSILDNYNIIFNVSGVLKGENCRSNKAFSATDRAAYVWEITWDYPILWCLAGASAGDMGTNEGGNRTGVAPIQNGYVPYTPNGIGTKDLASWTFSHIVRACLEGEGPYYSTQGAQSAGNSYTYYRPDGSVYAVVDKSSGDQSTWDYTYPVDSNASYDTPDEDTPGNRWNRYKPTWNTDYYLIRNFGQNFSPADMSGTAPDATGSGCLTYNEISIANDQRECASHEEAIFRNFQWVMNEKKMVLILPFDLLSYPVFQIMEGNGITGLSMARVMQRPLPANPHVGNGTWAKANTGGLPQYTPLYFYDPAASSSTIPGDYRVTFVCLDGGIADLAFLSMNCGSLTPAAVAQNIIALSRLAFPRSPLVTNGTDYGHDLLGSRIVDNDNEDTDVGFRAWSPASQGDAVWKKRNSLVPLLVALIGNLHAKSNTSNNAVAKMLAGLQPLVKPLMFFNYDISNSLTVPNNPANKTVGVAKNCWLPRINSSFTISGGAGSTNYRYAHSQYLMPDREVTGFLDYATIDSMTVKEKQSVWYGGDKAQKFYAPKEMPIFLSVLLDSDTSPNRSYIQKRADGLLAQLTKYTPGATGRPDVTETAATKDPPNAADVGNALYGLEQVAHGMRLTKAKAITIYEDQSNTTGTITIDPPIKQMDPPEWFFLTPGTPKTGIRHRIDDVSKYVDLDMDKLLNKVKGGDDGTDLNKGLNRFHDSNTVYNDGVPDWSDVHNANDDGLVDIFKTIVDDFLVQGSQYCVSEDLFNIIDVMYQHNPTPAQIKGLLYNVGKLLAYYDTAALPSATWLLQGDTGFSALYDLLMNSIPIIDDEMALYSAGKGEAKGAAYRSLLHSLQITTADNGLVQFIVDSVSIGQYSSSNVMTELQLWLESDLISGPNTEFYSTLASMLEDMSEIVSIAPTEEELYSIYEEYGFQPNL